MSNILNKLKKVSGNELAFNLSDENNIYTIDGYIDTGCYFFNAIICDGNIYGGLPLGKRTCFAGKQSTAKSLLTAHIIKAFLEQNANGYVVFFESEGATINEMCKALNIETERILLLPVGTVEEFKAEATKMLDEITVLREKEKENPPKFLMVLDSLGMLASEKEYNDAVADKRTQDMTRGRVIKSIFRLITLKLSITKTPLIIVSHAYDTMDLFSRTVPAAGSGTLFASDTIIILSKAKQKKGTEQIGAIITATIDKARFCTEGKKVKLSLLFKKGLNKYSYLIDFGEEVGLIKKINKTTFEFQGEEFKYSAVNKNPADFFTKDRLDVWAKEIKGWLTFDTETDVDDNIDLTDDEDEENTE